MKIVTDQGEDWIGKINDTALIYSQETLNYTIFHEEIRSYF